MSEKMTPKRLRELLDGIANGELPVWVPHLYAAAAAWEADIRQKQEYLNAHLASFGALVDISRETDLEGEVDAYSEVWHAVVRLRKRQEAAERVVDECGRIRGEAHYRADIYGYDLMRTVLAAWDEFLAGEETGALADLDAEVDAILASLPPEENETWTPHVVKEGSREHVVWWDSNGSHCKEPTCEMNRPPEESEP